MLKLIVLIMTVMSSPVIANAMTDTEIESECRELPAFMVLMPNGISVDQDVLTIHGQHILIDQGQETLVINMVNARVFTMDGEIIVRNNDLVLQSASVHPYTGEQINKSVVIRRLSHDDTVTSADVTVGAKRLYGK